MEGRRPDSTGKIMDTLGTSRKCWNKNRITPPFSPWSCALEKGHGTSAPKRAEGNQYWVYDGDDFVQGSPRSITDYGFPHDLNKIDAVMIWKKNGKTFFYADWRNFYSSSSSNVSTSAGRLCLSSSQNFSLSHTSLVHFSSILVNLSKLFSVTRLQSTSLPFLSISPNFPLSHTGDKYWRFNETEHLMDVGYPHNITRWRGVPSNLDAAMTWADGTLHLRISSVAQLGYLG
uniref:Uncharacterized protein n=1 Tax=Timema monikensis TaxID=170555 RepID=A0A7R9EJA2_9NEOP|nr:unnamed protein product [Timema monikensis]